MAHQHLLCDNIDFVAVHLCLYLCLCLSFLYPVDYLDSDLLSHFRRDAYELRLCRAPNDR